MDNRYRGKVFRLIVNIIALDVRLGAKATLQIKYVKWKKSQIFIMKNYFSQMHIVFFYDLTSTFYLTFLRLDPIHAIDIFLQICIIGIHIIHTHYICFTYT